MNLGDLNVVVSVDDPILVLKYGSAGDKARLISEYSPALFRVAAALGCNRQTAEDVVQETWIGAIAGAERFEGRSSFKTWLYAILLNQARKALKKEWQSRAMVLDDGSDPMEDRFYTEDHPLSGHWRQPPRLGLLPEDKVCSAELMEVLRKCLLLLPERQRQVVVLRDLEGMESSEVCELLGIDRDNQRVLLHRGRSKLRLALESYVSDSMDGWS
jgi:RNA polymerase sigma-70 factor (ECF subfamily)